MKFQAEFDAVFVEHIDTLLGVQHLTSEYGSRLSELARHQEGLALTLRDFALIARESPDAIRECLGQGHIIASYVLLRWFLESCHRCLTLWQHENVYRRWLGGEQIRAAEIGKLFQEMGLPTWKSAYEDWSHVAHTNAVFVRNAHVVFANRPKSKEDLILLEKALVYLLVIAHKFNMIFANFLAANTALNSGPLVERFRQLETKILELSKRQLDSESKFMNVDPSQGELNDEAS